LLGSIDKNVFSFEDEFVRNRRIIEEFASTCLVQIPNDLGRLVCVSQHRDMTSGRYRHPALECAYPSFSVHEALEYCHGELFERVLESPLEQLDRDLRALLGGQGSSPEEVAMRWLDLQVYRTFVPFETPSYLRDLFLSNFRAVLHAISAEPSRAQSAV